MVITYGYFILPSYSNLPLLLLLFFFCIQACILIEVFHLICQNGMNSRVGGSIGGALCVGGVKMATTLVCIPMPSHVSSAQMNPLLVEICMCTIFVCYLVTKAIVAKF